LARDPRRLNFSADFHRDNSGTRAALAGLIVSVKFKTKQRGGRPMPEHIKFILKHAAYGAVLAAVFVGALLYLNVGNLWHLVTHTSEGPIAVVMLYIFFTITLGSAQIGYKIMTLGEENDDEPHGGKRDAIPSFDPIPVPVRDERR
jgi:hypothetical protein